MRITCIIIGNPARRRPDGLGYVALTEAYEALVRTAQTMRFESTARTEAPETAEYTTRMIELIETDMLQAHDFEHLGERVPGAPSQAAGGRGRAGGGGRREGRARGVGGRDGKAGRGGRSGRGDEGPSALEIPSSSYRPSTTDIPSTSSSRPSTL
ncbi:uncharacterized protein LOC132039371 [Lycium ferocissimum]|uniref:uncharacterized protein LOC132039371 n=1 Tax=Lycium ferocissimum TaxID=112874 RepID=UPI002815A1CB|nr:uncharacterized protein LOC132039371 [Lycium ferocissimum]